MRFLNFIFGAMGEKIDLSGICFGVVEDAVGRFAMFVTKKKLELNISTARVRSFNEGFGRLVRL